MKPVDDRITTNMARKLIEIDPKFYYEEEIRIV